MSRNLQAALCIAVAAFVGVYSAAVREEASGAVMAIAYISLWHHILRGEV